MTLIAVCPKIAEASAGVKPFSASWGITETPKGFELKLGFEQK